jgi:hypothetical protein
VCGQGPLGWALNSGIETGLLFGIKLTVGEARSLRPPLLTQSGPRQSIRDRPMPPAGIGRT